MSDEQSKSKLSQALGKAVATTGTPTGKAGGLGGALARRDGSALAATGAPQTADISAAQKAVASSALTTSAVANDDARDRVNRSGICFVIDATGSRDHNWREAQRTQAQMFDALREFKDVEIGIVCHLGEKVRPLGWFKDAGMAKLRMGMVSCQGGQTRIIAALEEAGSKRDGKYPSSIILVGDAFEENFGAMQVIANHLKNQKTKVYAFLEGADYTAEQAFRHIADVTGGVFKRFGDGLDLTDLCVAVAVHDMGGQEAFAKLAAAGHKGANALLQDLQGQKRLGGAAPKSIGFKGS